MFAEIKITQKKMFISSVHIFFVVGLFLLFTDESKVMFEKKKLVKALNNKYNSIKIDQN